MASSVEDKVKQIIVEQLGVGNGDLRVVDSRGGQRVHALGARGAQRDVAAVGRARCCVTILAERLDGASKVKRRTTTSKLRFTDNSIGPN